MAVTSAAGQQLEPRPVVARHLNNGSHKYQLQCNVRCHLIVAAARPANEVDTQPMQLVTSAAPAPAPALARHSWDEELMLLCKC